MRTALIAISSATALVAFAAPASAATVFAGWSDGCGKSTCFNDKGVYTKTWSAAGANGPMTVSQLLLERGVLGALDSKTFRLSFRLNGQELGTWGSFTMGGIAGDQLTFGGQEFTWNPEDGDLELVLELIPPPKEGFGGGGFVGLRNEAPQGGPDETPSEQIPGGEPGGGGPQGPIGGEPDGGEPDGGVRQPPPPLTQTAAVPEPSSWAMMIGGFGLAGALFRRRRVVLPAQPCR